MECDLLRLGLVVSSNALTNGQRKNIQYNVFIIVDEWREQARFNFMSIYEFLEVENLEHFIDLLVLFLFVEYLNVLTKPYP